MNLEERYEISILSKYFSAKSYCDKNNGNRAGRSRLKIFIHFPL
ncbi:hypothetical protein HMPREF1988_00634 [Porphyromonas gingivalis F0185]|nr:hypothetical protein A343_2117 [Porphyromonas gingivalis JCVI SC001]ERJ84626.1 hypothetical protein HMPREF1988_00634 [Porphyromonas gingivalis F0185]